MDGIWDGLDESDGWADTDGFREGESDLVSDGAVDTDGIADGAVDADGIAEGSKEMEGLRDG